MSDQSAPDWVVPAMRAGYAARGVVYLVLGGLTLSAAFYGGQAEGTTGAFEALRSAPFGQFMLWLVALGFFCYAIWRFVAAAYDLENRGDDKEGAAQRAALVVTGLIHAALGVGIAALAMGSSGSGGGASNWTAQVMQMPAGRWLVGIAALGIAGAGVHYVLKGWQKKYKEHIQSTETTRKLEPVLRWGFASYGIVLVVVGIFLMIAALYTDPSSAVGIGGALETIRGWTAGPWLLALIGLGIAFFGVENLVEARYRIVEGVDGSDKLKTLASRAKNKAQAAT